MELKIVRRWLTEKTSIGLFLIQEVFECFTLEDKVRADGIKVAKATAVPAMRYRVTIDFSERFKRYMLHILDVPNFTGVRVHSGNDAEDTEGCPLVGQAKAVDEVLQSRAAYAAFFPKVSNAVGWDAKYNTTIYRLKEPTFITIVNDPESDTRLNTD